MGRGLAYRLRGTLVVARTFPGQRRVPFLPAEEIARRRDARVRSLVRYAAETVPHYRELFAREGIDPRELRSAADLRRALPVIDKDALRSSPDAFRSTSPRARDAAPFHTTGSTGVPMTYFHDRRSLLENIAYAERQRAVAETFGVKRFGGVYVTIAHAAVTSATVHAEYRRSAFRPLAPERHRIGIDERFDAVVARLNELKPDLVHGFGTYLEEFFLEAVRRGVTLHRPRVVQYTSDPMSPYARRLIETEVGVPVVSNYSAGECFKIGYFCEQRNGFHVHEDLCDLWIADEHGRALPPGARGEVVISNLVNHGTVLLNYRLGDLSTLRPAGCACGRPSRLLEDVEGRVGQSIRLPGGDIVHHYALLELVRRFGAVTRYQLVQHEPERYELRVTTADEAALERTAEALRAGVSALLGGGRVEVIRVDNIPRGPRGKLTFIVPLSSGEQAARV